MKEELIKTYWTLFFDEQKLKRDGVANNLIKLFKDATLTEITSLEELLIQIINWDS